MHVPAAETLSKIDPTESKSNDNNNDNNLNNIDKHEQGAAAAAPSSGGRALASGRQFHALDAVSPLNKLAKIKELNGGLWGPNDDEEQEIAQELASLKGNYIASDQDPYDLTLYPGEYSYSYSYEYEYDTSYEYSYEYEYSYHYY